MPVSYEEAREIAREATEPNWTAAGTYCLDDRRIVENDNYYIFATGAREFLVDGDFRFSTMGGTPAVRKDNGQFEWIPSLELGSDKTIRSRENPHPTIIV